MSRSGYSEDCDDQWALIRWRGAVASAIGGKRGQAFLRDMLSALDSLPNKQLIKENLKANGEVCAIGSVGLQRGIDMSKIDPYDREALANAFGISPALAAEIMYENDEGVGHWIEESPENRWQRIRRWIKNNIKNM